jgi:hypothetical protein
MRHHFRHPQAMLNKGSLFYSHCAFDGQLQQKKIGAINLKLMQVTLFCAATTVAEMNLFQVSVKNNLIL